jgi:hypothetical protein
VKVSKTSEKWPIILSTTVTEQTTRLANYLFIPESLLKEKLLYRELVVFLVYNKLKQMPAGHHKLPRLVRKFSDINLSIKEQIRQGESIHFLVLQCLEDYESKLKSFGTIAPKSLLPDATHTGMPIHLPKSHYQRARAS